MQYVPHVTQGQPLPPYPTHTRHDLASSLMPGGNTSASGHPLHAVAHSPSVSAQVPTTRTLLEIFQEVNLPVPVDDVMRKLSEHGLDRLEDWVELSDPAFHIACEQLGEAIRLPLKMGFRHRLRNKTAGTQYMPPAQSPPPTAAAERQQMELEVAELTLRMQSDSLRLQHVQGQLCVAPPAASRVEEEVQCVVCMDERKQQVMMPCMHMCVCEACAQRLLEVQTTPLCPVCRTPVESTMRVFT